MNKDLTVGKPQSVLWRFCLPLFGSVIFQQLYNIADSFVAGKFVGEDALAAVGNSYEITLIFIAFAFGCNIGCSVTVSRLFGAKRYGEMKTAVSTALISSAVLCFVLVILGTVFGDGLLRLINTPEDILADSGSYLRIYIWGLPFVFFYNVSTGIFSALGDSRTPFIFLTASSLANIGMDILFTTAFSSAFAHGVDGVAWATFICQGVSCVLAVVFVFRRLRTVRTDGKQPLFSLDLFRNMATVAVPSIFQQSFISVGNILIQGMINDFGTGVIAGYAAAIKLNNLVITSVTTVGTGISNYTAQNIGAGKTDRVREGLFAGIRLVCLICLPFAIAYFFAGRTFVLFFLDDPSAEALSTGMTFLRIVAPFYFAVAVKLVFDGIFRGSEHMRYFIVATFTDLLLRVILAYALSGTSLGSTGIWLAWPIGWMTAFVISASLYLRGRRKGTLCAP